MSDRIRPADRTDLTDRHRVDYAGDLNEQQYAAVMHPGGPMLVLAHSPDAFAEGARKGGLRF